MSSAMELFSLASDVWQVRVAPSLGGAVVDARWRERDVLRPTSAAELEARNVRKTACYPLVPFSNRIAFGTFTFGDSRYTLAKNFDGISHAIHGVGCQRAWSIQTSSASAIEMRLAHTPDAHWPFAFEAQQRIAIDGDTITLHMRVINTDSRAAPCGVGWHPFYPLDTAAGATHLHTTFASMLVADANDLPCASTKPPQFGVLDEAVVDNCFTGWSRRARIDTPHHRISIEASDALRCAVVFRPRGQAFFAFEPVSHANNALNGNEPPMHVLSCGEALDASVVMSMQTLNREPIRSES